MALSGKIISFTLIRLPPLGFEQQAPYPLILVKLETGKMFTGQLVDHKAEDLKVGVEVETVFRRINSRETEGVIRYGIKLRPVQNR